MPKSHDPSHQTGMSVPNHAHHSHGESAGAVELDFRVEGMTCAGCAAAVQRSLESLPGVHSAAVNATEGRAHVTGEHLAHATIVQAVRAAGYDAEPIINLPAPAEWRSEIEQRQIQHEREWKRRAIIGLSIWAPLEAMHWIMKLGAGGDLRAHGGIHWMDWLMLAGATVVLTVAGGGFYRSAWSAALRRSTNMDTLIAMGATTAYVYSLVLLIMRVFGSHIEHPMYFAEAAALLGIISLGHWLEARATAKAGSAVRELLQLQPDQAEVIRIAASDDRREVDGGDERTPRVPNTRLPYSPAARSSDAASTTLIPSAEVKPGDHILIRPGGRVPVDGVVIEGASDVDESVVSGESMPVQKSSGSTVVAGAVNTTGRLIVQATVDGRHTTVARIADMVQRAQTSRANIQRLADYIASIFVPVVLVIAAMTLIGWTIAGDFPTGVISTVTVLIISCPCALGLATPMAVMVGTGAASKAGILVKSAAAFEAAGNAAHIIFDKTGTLTSGAAVVIAVTPTGALQENEILRLAAAVESPSEHPIARAIVNAAHQRGVSIGTVMNFRAIPGQGVSGMVEGKRVTVTRDEQATARVELEDRVIGTIMVADHLREDARTAVDQLREMGLQVFMLSGDRRAVAESVGRELALPSDQVVAEATPESKVAFVASLSRARSVQRAKLHATTIMVGDGINDAAALAQADIGIAMASGTNIAIESADVVIPSNRLTAVPQMIFIARQTLRTIKQNLFFAFIYNAMAIPAAAFGLLGVSGPLIAAAAMGLSDITVIGNAIRLKRRLARLHRATKR